MRRLDNIDLRLLRVFVVLADANGFAEAQITLNLSQSTLSTHLGELEKRIGAKLCLRGRHKFRLTDFGQATYDAARKLAFIPSGGAGVLEVISVADPAHISVIQHVQTEPGSRTGTVDPTTGKLYLMSSKPDPNAKGRGQRLAGSFEVLVISP